MERKNILGIFILAIGFVLSTAICAPAQATLVSPKRVMIDDKERATAITIVNRSNQTKVYNFSWERRAQSITGEDLLLGKDETIAGYQPADDYLVYSPRQVIIRPGKTQKIRILARRPADLPEGEYHSHLLISPTSVPTESEPDNNAGSGVGGVIEVIANISIPVFLRQGKTTLDFDLTSNAVSQKNGRTGIKMDVVNRSTRSVYMKPVLECVNAQNQTQDITLQNMKLYAEAKTQTHIATLPKGAPPLNACSSAQLKLIGLDDFEYDRAVIRAVDIK